MRRILICFCFFFAFVSYGQDATSETSYKKRVLESSEIDFLFGYYTQDGNNAAVSGGIGTEELTDVAPTIIVTVPLNDDDILTVDASVSAYSSASSSNVGPFDGAAPADPFVASSGASSSDELSTAVISYAHSSDSRNDIWSAKLSLAVEYDYFSVGFGGSYTKLFNEKNTEISITGNVFLDKWNSIYPTELRTFAPGGIGLDNILFTQNTITGNAAYNPMFTPFENENRNSYAVGFGFSQILSKKLQGSLALDLITQDGLLSTPFQRVYFSDVADSFIDNFHLADAVEQLPDARFKVALGGRLNYYLNETFVLRTYYRYYFDDWGIQSHTASIEIPIKISDKFTLYPTYRFYNQTQADYFAPYNAHLSSADFFTSDFDLSKYFANQYGFGVTYTDIFTNFRIWKVGLKSVDLRLQQYERNTGLKATNIAIGFSFIAD